MDTQETNTPRTPNPRRKKRSKMQIFKEAYLPMIIVAVTFVLLLVFIIGGISRRSQADSSTNTGSDTSASTSTAPSTQLSPDPSTNLDPALQAEAQQLMAQAAALIPDYDYAGALEILDSYSGDRASHPALSALYDEYAARLAEMVPWTGDQVVNLSIHLLIEDPERAFQDGIYGASGTNAYLNNFLTTTEFSTLLQQLYDNGCILVNLNDLYELQYDASSGRHIYVAKTLLLPPGKTPIMLTETNANYYTYMTDSNGNGTPDANGDGFAYKLCFDENGFYNEIVLADGSIATGAFDIVPLLEAFIAEHPDFSFRNARAIIAVTGYDGVLGYRFLSSKLTEAEKQVERDSVAALVARLKEVGYQIACFTFNNLNYGTEDSTVILEDLERWRTQIEPVIGATDIIVLPKEGDIAGTEENYNDVAKFNIIYDYDFRFFLGTGTESWHQVDNRYVRHNRLMVTGKYLSQFPERFADLFDAATVLDPYRSNFA